MDHDGAMSFERRITYPGEAATPQQVVALADEYRRAAEALLATGRRRDPLSRAPYRLVAIHAIELYLNALLLSDGCASVDLRRMHHDLSSRTNLATADNLRLRRRTAAHLATLSATREYLATRYDPHQSDLSELTHHGQLHVRGARKRRTARVHAPTDGQHAVPALDLYQLGVHRPLARFLVQLLDDHGIRTPIRIEVVVAARQRELRRDVHRHAFNLERVGQGAHGARAAEVGRRDEQTQRAAS